MRTLTPDDVSGEEAFELAAAFGPDAVENGEIIRLDPDDLVPPPEKHFPMEDLLSEGDWVTVQHLAGNVTTGLVTEVKPYGFAIDVRNRVATGFFGYESFGGERGLRNELIDLNGEPVDVVYEPEVQG